MRFHADLHVHSKYSRATSRDLDLEHLAHWAARKGIGVVATGDFTHPAWRDELKKKLVPAESGLFRLRDEIEQAVAATLPATCRRPVRFMLEVEISTIYKKNDKTRKIHHLIYAPDFEAADRISDSLARIGNIASDGRPILGLDSRDLLEITLESDPGSYLIPAHMWTPWFAVLGSQSGFDTIEECYGDLTPHIFAAETGLSSDPPMNWRISFLDRYRLVSNSDAHSPGKLGREATTFDCDMDYFAIRRALETGDGYVGTVEFFPEEGKYHSDGHRKCGVRLTPRETLANNGRCPVCGEAVTVGVEHRVEVLADRGEGEAKPPLTAGQITNLVPLPEMLAEIMATGAASKAVERDYDRIVAALGPELCILQDVPVEDVKRADSTLLAEAIARLRAGKVIREAGYDGEYGVIRLFEDRELKQLSSGGLLFDGPLQKRIEEPMPKAKPVASKEPELPVAKETKENGQRRVSVVRGGRMGIKLSVDASGILSELDEEQRKAASKVEGALLIIAGPGSGKTRTLTTRIAHLVAECGILPSQCLAITFTRRAAAEMRERLAQLFPTGTEEVEVHTFHSLGLAILREHPEAAGLQPGFRIASEPERIALLATELDLTPHKAESLLDAISASKRSAAQPAPEIADARATYKHAMTARNWIDFDDLIGLPAQMLAADAAVAMLYRARFRFISVDEFQDVDEQQYRLLRLLAPAGSNVCVIGDPDQAIYGFRGADASSFERFRGDHPNAKEVRLARNYRSSGTIVTAAAQVIDAAQTGERVAEFVRDMHERIAIHTAPSEVAEAEFVIATIEELIGGHTFFSIDSGRANGGAANLSFADFAVLYRTRAQADALTEAFARSGVPFKKHEQAPLAEDPALRAVLAELDPDEASLAQPLAAALSAAATRARANRDISPRQIDAAVQRLGVLAAASRFDRTRFYDAVAVTSEADFFDPRADRVSLLTMHAAKGLEFPVVFIVGLEDGVMPLYWDHPNPDELEEERRLFYVGMTRAKDRLILVRALKRLWRGRLRQLQPSPFLGDIEAELIKQQMRELPPHKPQDRQLTLF
jgi:uncharacterized protein (TIGR00375 family)